MIKCQNLVKKKKFEFLLLIFTLSDEFSKNSTTKTISIYKMDNSLFESYELDLISLLNDLNLKLNKEILLLDGGKLLKYVP